MMQHATLFMQQCSTVIHYSTVIVQLCSTVISLDYITVFYIM